MLSAMMSSIEWQTLQYIFSLCVICVIFYICRVVSCRDFSDVSLLIPSLLVYYCLSLPMRSTGARQQPVNCDAEPCGQETTKKNLPALFGPVKKKVVKEKRKRRKSREKDQKDSSVMDKVQCMARGYPSPHETSKFFTELRKVFSLEELYTKFEEFVLSSEQKEEKGFPLESEDRPGYIKVCNKYKNEDPTSRTCVRCFKTFSIISNGNCNPYDNVCFYHPNPVHYSPIPVHSCCMLPSYSQGCRKNVGHVFADIDFSNIVFRKTDGNRQIRKDQEFKVYALDCEMVYTTIGMEVAKISLVDMEGCTIYDNHVVPENRVVCLNTQYSGITAQDLQRCNITLEDAQSALLKYLNKDTILVGHALQNDLKVLRIIHDKVVDTQVVFHEGFNLSKLKYLAKQYLQKSIQDIQKGHDSIEDARTCMDLMLWKITNDIKDIPYKRVPEINNTIPENVLANSGLNDADQNQSQRNVSAEGNKENYPLPPKRQYQNLPNRNINAGTRDECYPVAQRRQYQNHRGYVFEERSPYQNLQQPNVNRIQPQLRNPVRNAPPKIVPKKSGGLKIWGPDLECILNEINCITNRKMSQFNMAEHEWCTARKRAEEDRLSKRFISKDLLMRYVTYMCDLQDMIDGVFEPIRIANREWTSSEIEEHIRKFFPGISHPLELRYFLAFTKHYAPTCKEIRFELISDALRRSLDLQCQ